MIIKTPRRARPLLALTAAAFMLFVATPTITNAASGGYVKTSNVVTTVTIVVVVQTALNILNPQDEMQKVPDTNINTGRYKFKTNPRGL